MRSSRNGLVAAIAGAVVFLSACTGGGPQATASSPAPTTEMSLPASQAAAMNMFGGPVYDGEPALAATAALIAAGGGVDQFSFQAALVSMLGQQTVDAEVAKLTTQYSADQVKTFLTGMDFAVDDAIKIVTADGITLPAPADLHGTDLAKALVQAGTDPDGTWWSGYLFDKTISHKIHNQVMTDINNGPGVKADETTHQLLNQAMFDVAQALGATDVKLASLH